MRIYYELGEYVSFRVSGLAYMECLRRLGYEVTTEPEDIGRADAAILHVEPTDIPPLFVRHPRLRAVRVIAYCVWEGGRLPRIFADSLSRVREVWTCSRHSQRAFLGYVPSVAVVPHVVERRGVPARLLEEARLRIGGADPEEFLFFSIVDAINPRKDVRSLLFAFSRLRGMISRRVRLILKQYREVMDFSSLEGVCSVSGDLGPEEMRALHLVSHAYVSAHHAEGWGLGMSEAMAFGKPVIATGYSGNMDFMNEENSFPVPYTLEPVSEEMIRSLPWFAPDMTWAAIDKEALIHTMKRVAEGRYDPGLPGRAADIVRTFGPDAVAAVLRGLLEGKSHVPCCSHADNGNFR